MARDLHHSISSWSWSEPLELKVMPFVAKHLVYHPVQWLRGEPVRQSMRDLNASQFLPRDRLEQRQEALLKRALERAYRHIPYYRRLFDSAGLKPASMNYPDDLARIPFLTKTGLREHKGELVDPDYRGRVSSKTTGGSTGQAVTVVKDRIASAYSRGVMWRNYAWWDIDVGDRQGRFWGIPITAKQRHKYQLVDLLSNRIRLSSFDFSDDDLLDHYHRLKRFRPRYLYGYASMIYEFAAFLDRKGLNFSVPMVIPTSEVLYPHQRELIQRVLGCRVANEYGCGEVGPIAFECPAGGTHLMADNLLIEVLREDGMPAQPGELGQVVLTELHSEAMPLIRYQISDSVVLSDEVCACGRGLPLIQEIVGRAYDYLVSRSGHRFHGEKVMYLLEHLQDQAMGIRNIQVVQESIADLNIFVLRDTGFQDRALDAMRAYFREAMGDDLNIAFEFVDVIPRAPSGKFRVVIRNF
jgi:phenylacetate-coenzyme A ligase PaaK-like adenylate-forming protein